MAEKKFYYGGQAVIEGVMMRGKQIMATATRRPNGEIGVYSQTLSTTLYRQMEKDPAGPWRDRLDRIPGARHPDLDVFRQCGPGRRGNQAFELGDLGHYPGGDGFCGRGLFYGAPFYHQICLEPIFNLYSL